MAAGPAGVPGPNPLGGPGGADRGSPATTAGARAAGAWTRGALPRGGASTGAVCGASDLAGVPPGRAAPAPGGAASRWRWGPVQAAHAKRGCQGSEIHKGKKHHAQLQPRFGPPRRCVCTCSLAVYPRPIFASLVQVSVVQGKNFSWFGYPDDTEDGARNFLPGLGSEEQGLAVGLEQASAFSQDRVAGSGSRGSQGPGGPPLASLAHAAVGVESAAPAAFAAGAALEAAQAALCECLLRLPVVDWVLQPLTGAASRRLAAAAMQQAVGRAGYTDSVAAHHVAGDTSTTVSPARGDELGGHSSACSPTAAREGFGGEGTAATSVALRGVHVSGIHLTGPCAAEATHDQASGGSSNGASQPWRLATARHNAVRPQCTPQRTGQSNPRWAASCGEPPLAAAMGVGGGPSGSIGAGAGSSAGSSSSLGPDPAVAAMLASEEAEVLPPVALGTVTVRNGSLNVYILGKP